MGIASWALGDDNPFSKYVADNRQTLQGAFAGFGQGPTFGAGLGNAAIGAQRGTLLDDITRKEREEAAKMEEMRTRYAETLNSWGGEYADLAQGVAAGGLDPAQAYMTAWERRYKPVDAASPTSDMQNYQFYANEEIKAGRAPVSFMEFSNPASAPSIPSGYQPAANGAGLTFIPGGPADPTNQSGKPPTEAELRAAGLTTVIEPDAKLLLGDGTPQNPGIFEALGSGGDQFLSAGVGGIAPLSPFASSEYRQAKDAVTSIAQSYLYSTSGASAPDAEVQRVADSVTPKPFDTPDQIADKKARLEVMVNSVRQKQGNAAPSANAGDGWEVIGVQ